jgi:hypothetical protein
MLAPLWLAFKSFSIWGKLAGAFGSAWAWAVKNPMAAALLAAVLVIAFQHHVIGNRDAKIATLTTNQAAFVAADKINHQSIDTLTASLADQSALVRNLADAGKARQDAARAALSALKSDLAAQQADAARMRSQAALAPSADCKTHDAVLKGRNRL